MLTKKHTSHACIQFSPRLVRFDVRAEWEQATRTMMSVAVGSALHFHRLRSQRYPSGEKGKDNTRSISVEFTFDVQTVFIIQKFLGTRLSSTGIFLSSSSLGFPLLAHRTTGHLGNKTAKFSNTPPHAVVSIKPSNDSNTNSSNPDSSPQAPRWRPQYRPHRLAAPAQLTASASSAAPPK